MFCFTSFLLIFFCVCVCLLRFNIQHSSSSSFFPVCVLQPPPTHRTQQTGGTETTKRLVRRFSSDVWNVKVRLDYILNNKNYGGKKQKKKKDKNTLIIKLLLPLLIRFLSAPEILFLPFCFYSLPHIRACFFFFSLCKNKGGGGKYHTTKCVVYRYRHPPPPPLRPETPKIMLYNPAGVCVIL